MRKSMIFIALCLSLFYNTNYSIEKERLTGEWEIISVEDKTTGKIMRSKKGMYCRFYDGGTFMVTNLDTRLRTMWNWEIKNDKLQMTTGSGSVQLIGDAKFVTIEEPTELKNGIVQLVYEFYRTARYRDEATNRLRTKRTGPYVWTLQ